VQILEMLRVIELESREVAAGKTVMGTMHTAQRRTRRGRVIEQRVVEVEQDDFWDGERRHPHIIRRGCMVD
jgi:folate-dependent phosphoribosylglycinamide formyltransferase PurN